MPAVTTGKVLVTGANGYIAVWVVKSLLDAGFAVRGTVRSESKATHLRNTFKSFGDKLEIVVVEDITKEGAFDAYVKDVDAIAHTASPFHMHAIEPEEMIGPAVQGTLGVLRSAQAHAPHVRRVIVLSSTAAVWRPNTGTDTLVLDESSWNETEVAECRERGREASAMAKYRASKTLAERAAWDFVEKNKASLGWDLVVLNPPYVFGPNLHEVDRPENLGSSMRDWYLNVIEGRLDNDAVVNLGAGWVDVRDIAQAHVLALLKSEAGGNRFIITPGAYKWQDWLSVTHRVEPSLPEGNPHYDPSKAKHVLKYKNSKAVGILGIKFRSLEETAKDTVQDIKARGWLK
ncbi:NAD(P)-binding protein [Trametes maxima]|nr:NAD(P)-binding protein [Trametes maxima]